MRVKLKKDKVIAGSVWLMDSELDLPDDEASKLIEAGEAEAVSGQHSAVSDLGEEEPREGKKKKKAKEE